MTRVIIPYPQHRPILLALGCFKDYSNMKLEHIGELLVKFQNGEDVYYDFSAENLPELLNSLKFNEFSYTLIKQG
jgi:hypothetical protein